MQFLRCGSHSAPTHSAILFSIYAAINNNKRAHMCFGDAAEHGYVGRINSIFVKYALRFFNGTGEEKERTLEVFL